MNKQHDKLECLNAYLFVCSLNDIIIGISEELVNLTVRNYSDKFKNAIDGVNKLRYNIDKFLNKWEDDDIGLRKSLRNLHVYSTYYRSALCDSTSCFYATDAKYIKDSINTSKAILISGLGKLKQLI